MEVSTVNVHGSIDRLVVSSDLFGGDGEEYFQVTVRAHATGSVGKMLLVLKPGAKVDVSLVPGDAVSLAEALDTTRAPEIRLAMEYAANVDAATIKPALKRYFESVAPAQGQTP